jgi:hypothetical protein
MDLARADVAASAYPDASKLDDLERRLREALAETPTRFRAPVSGRDVMNVLQLPAGPDVGRIKARLEEMVLDGELPPDRAAVMAYLRERRDDLLLEP